MDSLFLSLWNDEYLKLIVEEDQISYQTMKGKWIKIRIPTMWSQGSSSSSSSSHSKTNADKSLPNNQGSGREVGRVQVSPPSSNSPKYSHNGQTTTKAKEINFQDEIAKLHKISRGFCKRIFVNNLKFSQNSSWEQSHSIRFKNIIIDWEERYFISRVAFKVILTNKISAKAGLWQRI